MPTMLPWTALRRTAAIALVAMLAVPVGAQEPTEQPPQEPAEEPQEGQTAPPPPPPATESGPCRPVEWTGGKPGLRLYPVLNMVAINWCLVGGTISYP